jgi:hypothetical protein
MFLREQVAEEDRDYLRFLIFGNTDGPCIAMRTVYGQIMEQGKVYPGAYKTITTTSLLDGMANYRPTTQQTEVLIGDDRMEALGDNTVVERIFSGQRERLSVNI